jgi:tRNA(His) 5'-end guanylyltransferase
MSQTLQQRMISYEDSTTTKIIGRIPVIIKIDGASFTRVTKNIRKPFCNRTMAMLNATMLSLLKQIDGAVFGYQYSDKIILVLRNDRGENEDPWFANDIQSMCSSSASKATYLFMTQLWEIDEPPNLEGCIEFKSKIFGVPNINEVINYIIYKQYCCMQYSINESVYSVLGRRSALEGTDIDGRKKILDEAGVSLDDLPASFRHGSSAYVIPKLAETTQGVVTHYKWILDFNTPLFVDDKERERLRKILKTGSDVFRQERDL